MHVEMHRYVRRWKEKEKRPMHGTGTGPDQNHAMQSQCTAANALNQCNFLHSNAGSPKWLASNLSKLH